jgi:glycerol uptake facilitator-like aquaporin
MSAKSYFVEFYGTFMLTFVLGMVRITNQENLLCVGLAYFFMVVCMVHIFFHFSSAQFNPILSLSLLITKQNSTARAVIYMICQLMGSFAAGTLLYLINNGKETGKYYGAPQMNAAMRDAGLIFEMISMFLLVLVYSYFMSNVTAPKYVYGTSIAGVYTVAVVGFGFISGGALNFSFVFGPTIFMEFFVDWPFYLMGQLLGGILSGIIYRLFLLKEEDDDDEDEIIDESGVDNEGVPLKEKTE